MKFIISCLFLFITSHVAADCANNICNDVTIDKLYLYPNGKNLRFTTSGDEQNLNCTPNSGQYIYLDMSQAYAKETVSVILAAHQARSLFWVNTYSDANGVCHVTSIQSKK